MDSQEPSSTLVYIPVGMYSNYMASKLFSGPSLFVFLNEKRDRILREIQAGDKDDIIQKDPKNASEWICSKNTIDLLNIEWDKRHTEGQPNHNDDTITVTVCIPFTGDKLLLHHSPQTGGPVEGEVVERHIRVAINIQNQADLRPKFERWKNDVIVCLESANERTKKFNSSLCDKIEEKVEMAASRIRKAREAANSLDPNHGG